MIYRPFYIVRIVIDGILKF